MLKSITKKQAGLGGTTLMAAGLSLLVMSVIAVNGFKQGAEDIKAAKAKAQGQQLKSLSDAMNTYMVKNFAALSCGTGGTCATVAGVTDKYHPMIAELKAIGVLDYSVQPTSIYGTGLLTQVATVPTGCTGSTCSLTSLVYTASPVIDPTSLTVEGSVLGQAIVAGGADVGASVSTGNVNGLNGSWSVVNPVAGSPAGILAARSGAGSAFDPTAYVKRDGTLPMTGTFQTAGNAIDMAGGNLLNGGQVNATTVNSTSVNASTVSATANVNTGTVTLNTIAVNGTACSPNGSLAKDNTGALLTCVAGAWKAAGASAPTITALSGSWSGNYTYTYTGTKTPISLTGTFITYGGGNREGSVRVRWRSGSGAILKDWSRVSGFNIWNGNDGGSGMHAADMATIPFITGTVYLDFQPYGSWDYEFDPESLMEM